MAQPDLPSDGELMDSLGGASKAQWIEAATALLSPGQTVDHVNDEMSRFLGQPARELADRSFGDLLEARQPGWKRLFEKLLHSAQPTAWVLVEAGDASFREWFRIDAARNEAGFFVSLSSVLPPLEELIESPLHTYVGTEPGRRRMFVRLLRAESRLESIIRRWPGVIFTQRADFSFQFVSPRLEELTGLSAKSAEEDPHRFWSLIHEADVDDVRQRCALLARGGTGQAGTFRLRHATTGRVVYVLEHRHVLLSESGLVLAYEGVWLDVTRQTLAEKRLSSASWKETLATITMGLAHDFNNIMAGILSLSETLLSRTTADHPFRESLGLIRDGSMNASQLTRRIANLHKGKIGEYHYHDLNEIVRENRELVGKVLPRRILVQMELAGDSLPVYVDAVEFRQVILNLALNAAEAMPQRGQLTLRTTRHETQPSLDHPHGILPRPPCVCLSVQDSGSGIAPRHLPFIFDPFFTTKPLNRGSGLGLYNARLFVEKHQGAISVESVEGSGTTFHLWLAQADFTESERGVTASGATRPCLLVVGSEGPILGSTVEFLRTRGCYVVQATDGPRALDLIMSSESQFHGVMIQAVPGDPSLISFSREVRRYQPAAKIVLQVVGGDPDDVPAGALENVDLAINSDIGADDIIRRLQPILDVRPSP